MSEEMDDASQAPATCDMCTHAKHDQKTCDVDGCECGSAEE